MRICALLSLIVTFLLVSCAPDRFERYQITADELPRPSSGVRITYLGTSGFLLESRDATVLVDPYFTRIGFVDYFSRPVLPNEARIKWAFERLPRRSKRPDLVLVTHGHVDHALDAVHIAKDSPRTLLAASRTTCFLAQSCGLPAEQTVPLGYGEMRRFGPVRVQAFKAPHTKLLGRVPSPGELNQKPERPPTRGPEWIVGETLAFVIEIGKRRLYIGSGSAVAESRLPHVDFAALGVSSGYDLERFEQALVKLSPRYIFPTHQDNLFRPLHEGFHFLPTAQPARALQLCQQAVPDARIVMLDYFRPWTLQ